MYGNPYDLGGLGGPSGHDLPPIRYSGFTKDTISTSIGRFVAIFTYSTFIGICFLETIPTNVYM
jgi:hypothetical protein